MHVTLWIVVAFAVGVLFGRLTAGSASRSVSGPMSSGVAAAGWPASDVQAAQIPGSSQGAYRIMLLDRGPNILRTIKAIRAVTRLDLKSSKDLVDSVPGELIRVGSADQAQAIARAFQGVATVRVDGLGSGSQAAGTGYNAGLQA